MSPRSFFKDLTDSFAFQLKLDLRNPSVLLSALLFSAILCVLYRYALPETNWVNAAGGVLLATLFFVSTLLGSRKSFQEREGKGGFVVLLSPVNLDALFLGRVLAFLVLLLAFFAFAWPIYSLMLASRLPTPIDSAPILVVYVFVAIPMSSMHTLFHLVSSGNRFKEILLPLLIFPASLPLLILAVDVLPPQTSLPGLVALAGLGGVYLTVSLFLGHYLFLEED